VSGFQTWLCQLQLPAVVTFVVIEYPAVQIMDTPARAVHAGSTASDWLGLISGLKFSLFGSAGGFWSGGCRHDRRKSLIRTAAEALCEPEQQQLFPPSGMSDQRRHDAANGTAAKPATAVTVGKKRRKGQDLQPIQTAPPPLLSNGIKANHPGTGASAHAAASSYLHVYQPLSCLTGAAC
jgi:hypothetical protein